MVVIRHFFKKVGGGLFLHSFSFYFSFLVYFCDHVLPFPCVPRVPRGVGHRPRRMPHQTGEGALRRVRAGVIVVAFVPEWAEYDTILSFADPCQNNG